MPTVELNTKCLKIFQTPYFQWIHPRPTRGGGAIEKILRARTCISIFLQYTPNLRVLFCNPLEGAGLRKVPEEAILPSNLTFAGNKFFQVLS